MRKHLAAQVRKTRTQRPTDPSPSPRFSERFAELRTFRVSGTLDNAKHQSLTRSRGRRDQELVRLADRPVVSLDLPIQQANARRFDAVRDR
jgi:hypothetical protein